MAVRTDFPEYVSAEERRRRAQAAKARLVAEGRVLRPVAAAPRKRLASSFWGRAMAESLEGRRDAQTTLAKGRSAARSGAILDLAVGPGRLAGLVSGAELYQVKLAVPVLDAPSWLALRERCAASIESLEDLLEGRLTERARAALLESGPGLLPDPEALAGRCSCPVGQYFCKHQAALAYGLASRLDREPELLFVLRGVRAAELVTPLLPGLELPRP